MKQKFTNIIKNVKEKNFKTNFVRIMKRWGNSIIEPANVYNYFKTGGLFYALLLCIPCTLMFLSLMILDKENQILHMTGKEIIEYINEIYNNPNQFGNLICLALLVYLVLISLKKIASNVHRPSHFISTSLGIILGMTFAWDGLNIENIARHTILILFCLFLTSIGMSIKQEAQCAQYEHIKSFSEYNIYCTLINTDVFKIRVKNNLNNKEKQIIVNLDENNEINENS